MYSFKMDYKGNIFFMKGVFIRRRSLDVVALINNGFIYKSVRMSP
jgi:hypothetical protein